MAKRGNGRFLSQEIIKGSRKERPLNPAFPKREGSNPHGEKDANGKMFHDAFLKVVQTKGAGWVDYMFPKPALTQPSHKWSYVKGFKNGGMTGLIGAGFFAE